MNYKKILFLLYLYLSNSVLKMNCIAIRTSKPAMSFCKGRKNTLKVHIYFDDLEICSSYCCFAVVEMKPLYSWTFTKAAFVPPQHFA